MALVLDPTLAAAQDSQSRHPIVELISSQLTNDIPFDGQFLTSESISESAPNVIAHSSGRLCLVYLFSDTVPVFKYAYTDPDRTAFTIIEHAVPANYVPYEATLVELASGDVGIIYYATYTPTNARVLRYFSLTVEGADRIADAQIATYSSAVTILNPWVHRLASNGSFVLLYYHKTGATHSIMKRTSGVDFASWGGESALSIAGISSANARYNPSLLQIFGGDLFLWFDYVDEVGPNGEERTNVYYSISTDEGVNWDTAVKVTNYLTFTPVGKHPIAVQKHVDEMHLVYHERNSALHMDTTTSGWCGTGSSITDMHFDRVGRKLYAVSTYVGAGMKRLYCVVKIDVDTWSIDDCWNCTTVPPFPSAYCSEHVWWSRHHGESHYASVGTLVSGQIHVSLVDGDGNTVTDYHFTSWPAYGYVKNVTWTSLNAYPQYDQLAYTWVDATSNRLYVAIFNLFAPRTFQVGYLTIGGDMTFTQIIGETNQVTEAELYGLRAIYVSPGDNLIFVLYGWENTGAYYTGRLRVHLISDGSLWKDYKKSTYTDFPYHGLIEMTYRGGKIYGGFEYDVLPGESLKRGLCIINLADNSMTYNRPPTPLVDDYKFQRLTMNDEGLVIIATEGYGIMVFDPSIGTWRQHSNDTIPGLTQDDSDRFLPIAYDDEEGIIFTGTADSAYWKGVVAFSVYGFLCQAKYRVGAFTTDWAFDVQNDLCRGIEDYELAPVLDPVDQSIYGFWTNQKRTELSIKWDREGTDFDVTPYLVKGSELTMRRTVDGKPSRLSFTVSHGHLFDPHNLSSLWSIYLKKFRALNLRFGEKIEGIDYWQQAGEFIIKENRLSWQRPRYPSMEVDAEDRRVLWEAANVVTTDYYETDPKTILEDVLTTYGGFLLADCNFPIFDTATTVYFQWIETPLKDIIEQICYRFGYFPRLEVDGKASARKISDVNSIDHVYADSAKILNFTPDDSFSDFTNRVIITCEGRDFIEVLYNEEPVCTLNGTVGWWGGHRHRTAHYSEDDSRRCRNPRLEVIESVDEYNFKLGGGDERIESIDPSERWCEIKIDCPDMVGWLIGLIAAYIVIAIICSFCDCEYTCGICNLVKALVLEVIIYIIASIATYQYRVHANPIGYVRQSYQAIANDEDLQDMLGAVIEKKFSDPLCYSAGHAQVVANFEILIAKMQRNRVRFGKIADLRDEEGDTVRIPHPYTGAFIDFFVTDLTRKLKIPESPGEGSFEDDLEGWRIE